MPTFLNNFVFTLHKFVSLAFTGYLTAEHCFNLLLLLVSFANKMQSI